MQSADHYKMNVNIGGIHVGNSAQTTAALGVRYEILKVLRLALKETIWTKLCLLQYLVCKFA